MKRLALIISLIFLFTSCVDQQIDIANESCPQNRIRAEKAATYSLERALTLRGLGGTMLSLMLCSAVSVSVLGLDGGTLTAVCAASATAEGHLASVNIPEDYQAARAARDAVLRSDCR